MSDEKEKAGSEVENLDKELKKLEASETSSIPDKTIPHDAITSVQPGPQDAALALQKLDSRIVEKESTQNDPFAHLPEHEAEILRNQVFTPDVNVGYKTLFRYATGLDWTVFAVSVFCSVASGASMPLMTVSGIRSLESYAHMSRSCLVVLLANLQISSMAIPSIIPLFTNSPTWFSTLSILQLDNLSPPSST
jgi:hypothetical protein